jgi:LCP family protein required for cell wall assembly
MLLPSPKSRQWRYKTPQRWLFRPRYRVCNLCAPNNKRTSGLWHLVSLTVVRYTEYDLNRFECVWAVNVKSRFLALQLTRQEKTILACAVTVCVLAWFAFGLLLLGEYGWSGVAYADATVVTVVPAVPVETSTRKEGAGGDDPLPVAATGTAVVQPETPLPSATWTSTALPTATPTPTPRPPGAAQISLGQDTLVIALLGIDERQDAGAWRTDSIILAFVQMETKRVSLLSVPRDLWVTIPGHGHNRINLVDSLGERTHHPGGGRGLLDETMRYNLGVPVDHYLRVDFQGFVDIVDTLGGVTVYVEKPLTDEFPDPLSESEWTTLTLTVGWHHMDGRTALKYSRSRMTTDDFDRSRRQQQVLKALWEQAFTTRNLKRAPALWKALDSAFETDIKMVDAVWLASVFQGIDPHSIESKSLGFETARPWTTSQGAKVLLPQTEAIQQIIIDLLD